MQCIRQSTGNVVHTELLQSYTSHILETTLQWLFCRPPSLNQRQQDTIYRLKVYIYTGLQIYIYILGCIYVYIQGCRYVYILGCIYVYTLGCRYVYILGCRYVYTLGWRYVYILSCRYVYRAFLQVLNEDPGPHEDLFCEIVLIWSLSLEHQVLIWSLSSWTGMKMKKVCRFLSWFFSREAFTSLIRKLVVRFLMRCVTFCQGPAGKPALPH